MYSNYMYSNAPASSRRGGGSWGYVNGELYHFGIKGMKWGEHLPFTDYWKVGKNAYGNYMKKNTTVGFNKDANGVMTTYNKKPSKLKAFGYAVNAAGTYARNRARNDIRRAKDAAINKRNAINQNIRYKTTDRYYSNLNNFSEGMKNMPTSHLEERMGKLLNRGNDYIEALKQNPNSGIAVLNLAIKNAQFNVLNGINSFLKKTGLDKKVDKFLSKFLGESNAVKSARLAEKSANLPKIGPTNTRGYDRAEAASPSYTFDTRVKRAAKKPKGVLV